MLRAAGGRAIRSPQRANNRPTTTGTHHEEAAFASLLAGVVLALVAGSAAAEMKKVKIGTEGAYPPFNSIDPSGKVVGFDIDIANAPCKAANFECEFVVQDWDGMIPALQAKKFDAIIAQMSITDERKKVVDFTGKYSKTPAKFMATKGQKFGIHARRAGGQGARDAARDDSRELHARQFPEERHPRLRHAG